MIPLEAQSTPDPLSTMQSHVDHLIEIVDRYDLRSDGDLVHTLENLRKRTAAHQLTLAAFGDSGESKSSLIEALLKTTPAKASIPPSTAACTYLAYGPQTECAVTLADSMTARLPLEQLAEFINEKVPAANLKKVLVRFPNAALESGLVVIDTPELGDDPEAFLSSTASAIADADACFFAVKAAEGLEEKVIAFLRRMDGKLEKFFFVLDSSPGPSAVEREKSLELVRRSLEEHCGLAEPRIALLSSVSAEESDRGPGEGSPGAFQEQLLEFARISWQSTTSKELARVAAAALKQADAGLNLKETASLQRVRLRRAIKALDEISRQSAELAVASDAAMRMFVAAGKSVAAARCAPPPTKVAGENSQAPAEQDQFHDRSDDRSDDRTGEPEPEERGAHWQRAWEPVFTTHVPAVAATILPFPGKSSNTWVTPPTATPMLAYPFSRDPSSKDTTASPQPAQDGPVPVPVTAAIPRRAVPRVADSSPLDPAPIKPAPPASGAASKDRGLPSRHQTQEAPPAYAPRIFAGPAAPSQGWLANRDREPYDELDDEDEAPGGGVLAKRLAGIAALAAAVLTIAWAVVVILRPDLRQMSPLRVAAALSAPLRSGRHASGISVAGQPADTRPATAAGGSNNTDQAADPAKLSERPTPPLPAAPRTAANAQPSDIPQPAEEQTVSPAAGGDNEKAALAPEQAPEGEQHSTTPEYAGDSGAASSGAGNSRSGNSGQDAALETALDRWIKASRSGNVPAQATSYAPVVGTYFNSRNVTRAQVQAEEERASTGSAGIQNYRITTIGISTLGNGQRAVLLQKDWDTPTGQGAGFAAAEFERLVFGQVNGQWKIVGEQEVKLARTRGGHGAANF